MFVQLLLILGLVRVLQVTESPFLCSSIYTGAVFLLGLATKGLSLPLLAVTAISFVLASLYFWLLQRFAESFFYWILLVVGFSLALL